MSQQQPEQQRDIRRPMAWDPTCPARLCLLDPSTGGDDNDDNDNNNTFAVDSLYADTGAMSCNAYELAALYSIIQALQEYHQNLQQRDDDATTTTAAACQTLSRACRAAVQTCVQGWEESLLQEQDTTNDNNAMNDKQRQASMENLELLKSMHAIMHLSDVFLPLLQSLSQSLSSSFETAGEDAFEIPGVVTANAVRYLRLNHMGYAPDLVAAMAGCDASDITEMLESTQPEEYVVNGCNIYWLYVQALVKRGCLEQAWETLKLHSLYRNALAVLQGDEQEQQQQDPSYLQQMQNVLQGFGLVRLVLLRAPLPAGRKSEYDDTLGTPDFEDPGVDDPDYQEEGDNYNALLQAGLDVDPSDYKYWEVGTSAVGGGDDDVPVMYSPQAAMRKHKTWQEYVQDLRPTLNLARHVIPELDTHVLSILAGDFDNRRRSDNDNAIQFMSWAERLIAELLYKRPNLSPRQLHVVTRRTMLQYLNVDNDDTRNDQDVDDDAMLKEHAPMAAILLQIMQGHAAQAIETMYSLGGGSGAALPATLTSLLYNLFLESSIMPQESAFRKTEFICEAASAIVSSLSGHNNNNNDGSVSTAAHNNVGAHLAIQFLLPYAYPNDDDEYDNDSRDDALSRRTEVMALMANIMEHYEPPSESAARDLLDMCRPLLEATNSIVILEPCTSIVLCRYRKALRDLAQQQQQQQQQHSQGHSSSTLSNRASRAMEWLFQGMQLEVMVLNNGNRRDASSSSTSVAMMMGSCHRTLLCWCLKTSLGLLNAAANIIPINPLTVQTAKEMVQTVRHATRSDNNNAALTPLKIIEVRQLVCIQELYEAFMEQGDLDRAAAKIVDCLKDQVLSSDMGGAGTVATLVPFSMYVPLLQIAQQILRQEEETHDWNTPNPTCAFDKYGVSVLMQTDTRVTALSTTSSRTGATQAAAAGLKQREFSELLARALARAFVAENAKKKKWAKQQQQQQQYSQTDIASIRTVHLSEYPADVQEAVVQRMLDL